MSVRTNWTRRTAPWGHQVRTLVATESTFLRSHIDPFFVVSHNGTKLYRSEAIKKELNPTWAPFNLNIKPITTMPA